MTAATDELQVRGVAKRFGNVVALAEVSFSVAKGEFVTLLGPSGCGKTTLLRVIAGLEVADAGQVSLFDTDLTLLPAHRRPVNTVFQNYALFPHLNVFENIAFGLRSRRFDEAEILKRLGATTDLLQLEELVRRYPHELSGGQKQRVALARALVNEPELLLLDEPMSALDARLRAEVQIELRRLQRRLGKTFLLVTHDQDEAMTVSDRIIVMRDAHIEQFGPPSEVYERPVNRFVAEFLGSANLLAASRKGGRFETALGVLVARDMPAWDRGTFAIRPERIRIGEAEPAVNGLRVRVREMIYRGDHLDLFVEPGGLRIRTTPTSRAAVGMETWIELPPEHIQALAD